jgi:hypothetical protein
MQRSHTNDQGRQGTVTAGITKAAVGRWRDVISLGAQRGWEPAPLDKAVAAWLKGDVPGRTAKTHGITK